MTQSKRNNRRHKRTLKRLLDSKYQNIKTFCDEVGVCDRTMYTYFSEIDKTLKQDTFLKVCYALDYDPFTVLRNQNDIKQKDSELDLVQLIIELIPMRNWYIDPIPDNDYTRLRFQTANVLITVEVEYNVSVSQLDRYQETGEVDVSHSISDIEITDFQISRHKGQGFEFSDETYKMLTEQILLKIISENE